MFEFSSDKKKNLSKLSVGTWPFTGNSGWLLSQFKAQKLGIDRSVVKTNTHRHCSSELILVVKAKEKLFLEDRSCNKYIRWMCRTKRELRRDKNYAKRTGTSFLLAPFPLFSADSNIHNCTAGRWLFWKHAFLLGAFLKKKRYPLSTTKYNFANRWWN